MARLLGTFLSVLTLLVVGGALGPGAFSRLPSDEAQESSLIGCSLDGVPENNHVPSSKSTLLSLQCVLA